MYVENWRHIIQENALRTNITALVTKLKNIYPTLGSQSGHNIGGHYFRYDGRTCLDHGYMEHLDFWLNEADLEIFFGHENSSCITIADYVSILNQSSLQLGLRCTEIMDLLNLRAIQNGDSLIAHDDYPIIRVCCQGCNDCFINSHTLCRKDVSVIDLSSIHPDTSHEYCIALAEVHRFQCLISFAVSVLKFKSERSEIKRGQEKFIGALIGNMMDGNQLLQCAHNLNEVELMSFFPTVVTLVGVVDNSFRLFPRCAGSAITILSLCMACSPSAVLGRIDPIPLLLSVKNYIYEIGKGIHGATCIVEERFSICNLLNMLPLLYYLGDWEPSQKLLLEHKIPVYVVNICLNIIHNIDDLSDCPADLETFPELMSAVVHVAALFKENVPVMIARPMTFAACALIETLARWEIHCGLKISKLSVTTDIGVEAASIGFSKYLSRMTELTLGSPVFAFALPIFEAFAKSLPVRQPEVGVLRGPLLHASMKCCLPGCCVYENLKMCSGNCRGLARYCSAEHQKLDWKEHKGFCKSLRSICLIVG